MQPGRPARHAHLPCSVRRLVLRHSFEKRHADPCVACRKSPAPKAWSQGTNPITQRPTNPTPSNGVAAAPKPSTSLSRETATPMRHLSDRMMYLLANLTVRIYGRYLS